MIRGLGIDLCDVPRMEDALSRERFLARCFTPQEAAYIRGRGKAAPESCAGHFAAKEACLKALGTGMQGVGLNEVEVCHHEESGAPFLRLHGRAQEECRRLGVRDTHVSITHTGGMAAAVVVLEG